MIERVLPHQKQRGRLRQAIGTEIGSRIDGLFGNVEQQAVAGALRLHDPDRGLRHPLVTVEIQLEALPQHRLVNLADPPLTDAASVTSQRIPCAAPPIAMAFACAAVSSTSSSATSAPATANALA